MPKNGKKERNRTSTKIVYRITGIINGKRDIRIIDVQKIGDQYTYTGAGVFEEVFAFNEFNIIFVKDQWSSH